MSRFMARSCRSLSPEQITKQSATVDATWISMTTVLLAGVSAITSAIRIASSRLGAKSGSNGSGAVVGSGRNERSEVMPCLLDGGS